MSTYYSQQASGNFGSFSAEAFRSCGAGCLSLGKTLGRGISNVGTGLSKVASPLKSVAQSIATFVKNNWNHLIAYIIAWGITITFAGLIYGFDTVALPLTIGAGCGLGLGAVTGVATAAIVVHKNKIAAKFAEQNKASTSTDSPLIVVEGLEAQIPPLAAPVENHNAPILDINHYTVWGLLNSAIEWLDHNGSRQIMMPIIVTVILAGAVAFPYVVGGVIAAIIANHVAAKIFSGMNLGRSPVQEKNIFQLEYELELAKTKISQLTTEQSQLIDKFISLLEELKASQGQNAPAPK